MAAGSRLLRCLAMPASADTVLRLVHRLPLAEAEAPRVAAVDDWTLRKGGVCLCHKARSPSPSRP